jgi:N-acetylmuramoyl-L-alanine amidase
MKRQIDYIAVHCSATIEGADFGAHEFRAWHKRKGWADIGYHYVVRLNGKIELGRSLGVTGAHVAGFNSKSIGIVYTGGLDKNRKPKDTRTPEQKESLLLLITTLKKIFPNAIVQGHRDFPNVRKSCPCFDAKTEYSEI